MAARQTKRVKREKVAKQQADKIVKEAVAKVANKGDWDRERVEGCTDEQWALGVQCRTLREEGEPWWAIARAMDLPGSGDSATTGKKGASRARGIYAKAFGAFPRTFTTGRSTAEKNEHVKALQKTKKEARVKQAKQGKSVIGPDIPDEEVAEMLRGKRIRWWAQSDIIPEGMELEACVHPHQPIYIEGVGEERIIEFREQHRRAPQDVRWMPGKTRTVRLRQIFAVRQ